MSDDVSEILDSDKMQSGLSQMADDLAVLRILISRGLTTYDEFKRLKADAMPVARGVIGALLGGVLSDAPAPHESLRNDVERLVRSFVEGGKR